jgi:hypothetical protein
MTEIRIVEQPEVKTTEKLLKNYSYFYLIVAALILAYSVIRVLACPAGTNHDYCKLGGFSFWAFYGTPALILGAASLALTKLTESKAIQMIMLGILLASTFRLVAVLIGA